MTRPDVIVCGFWASRAPFLPATLARCSTCREEIAVISRELLAAGTLICPGCFLRLGRAHLLRAADPAAIEIVMGIAQLMVDNRKRLAAIAAN
jgi:hypothetical protein